MGLFSFSKAEVIEKQNATIDTLNSKTSDFNFVVHNYHDNKGYRCRAEITYNGEVVETVYGYGTTPETACLFATMAAVLYIEQQGGTYP
ncbi:hypothetical protein [Olleya sp. Hel_I_94]|uniref:hypothetical protein n=1 Tax=Olleya sp. Hel_I_94 TaxID=1250001 RepID=UPI0011A60AF3|nr:hypothetical protein [Olleya sp. Hel_I_94]TVZ46980.1 hypothetical protein JM82_1570 [Olleya sp. Hel_I_94]